MIAQEKDQRIIQNIIAKEAEQGRFVHKKVLIFGCTIYARDIRKALQEQGISLSGILDNNIQKAGKTCLGVPVYLPEKYFETRKENILVILCSKYHREMAAQLCQMGYESSCWINIPVQESKKKEEDSIENLQFRLGQVEEGYGIYQRIQKEYSGKSWLFLCPYPGTGDVYMACIYLEAYLEQEGIQDYVMVVTAESCRKTAALFGISNICKISANEMEIMLKAWEFFGTKNMQVKPMLYWGWRTKRYLYADEYPQITFNEMFLYDVFHLPSNTKKKRPVVNQKSHYVEDLFKKLELKPYKTVIMAPYAGSFVSEMGMKIWEQLAAVLKQNGWTVATNCFGNKDSQCQELHPSVFLMKKL